MIRTGHKPCLQCGRIFKPKRPHARYCSDRCRAIDWRENNGEELGERVQEHPLAEVRAEQEQVKEKARWTLVVREHMAKTLTSTGYFHSDDLDPLGIPEQHRNIAGSQTGSFVQRELMQEVGRRKSMKPSRKSAKSAIYRITEKGRKELAGVGGGNAVDSSRTGSAASGHSLHSGESDTAVPGPDQATVRGAGSASPDQSCAQGTGQEGARGDKSEVPAAVAEPLSLLPEPDPKAWAA
jgi:endogenous inhibitor of DNA gyrase (YacG/DUF329 family)